MERFWPVQIMVEGLNIERFIRQASEKEIILHELQRQGLRRLSAKVRESELPVLEEIALHGGWKISSGRRYGAGKAAVWIKWRWLLLVLIMFTAIFLFFSSGMMWRIEIVGAGTYEADIRQALADMGLKIPMLRGQIDIGSVQEALAWRYPRIAWFECGWRGTTLIVRAVEGVLPKTEMAAGLCDVVADRDAIVRQVVTVAGTAIVKPGDFVRKGDILIKGEERTKDGEMKMVTAQGTVKGRVWMGAEVRMSCAEVNTIHTGESQQVWTVRTPWFDLWSLDGCDYECYDVSISQQVICDVFFPVSLYTETRFQAEQSRTLRDLEQVKAEAKAASVRKLHEKIQDQESLIDIWGNCSMIDSENVLSVAIGELLVEIGVQRSQPDMAAPGH